MRVFRQGLILGGLLWALAAAPANATPILSSGDSGDPCDAVVGVAISHCRLFSVALKDDGTPADFDLLFESDMDVALFKFVVDANSTFAAATSSTGLFPQLGLFGDDAMKTIYTDPVSGEQALSFEPLQGIRLDGAAGGTTYYLAVLLLPSNGFGGLPVSLLAPFACDGENRDGLGPDELPLCPGPGGSFGLQFSATSSDSVPPVPEPATITLVATGALAALARRRSTKRNQRKNATRS